MYRGYSASSSHQLIELRRLLLVVSCTSFICLNDWLPKTSLHSSRCPPNDALTGTAAKKSTSTPRRTMGCCLTRRPNTADRRSSNKIGHESTTRRQLDTRSQEQPSPSDAHQATDVKNDDSAATVGAPGCVGNFQTVRQAFLDGALKLDARCPLDARQLYMISKSWKAINRNLSVIATNVFVRCSLYDVLLCLLIKSN